MAVGQHHGGDDGHGGEGSIGKEDAAETVKDATRAEKPSGRGYRLWRRRRDSDSDSDVNEAGSISESW